MNTRNVKKSSFNMKMTFESTLSASHIISTNIDSVFINQKDLLEKWLVYHIISLHMFFYTSHNWESTKNEIVLNKHNIQTYS